MRTIQCIYRLLAQVLFKMYVTYLRQENLLIIARCTYPQVLLQSSIMRPLQCRWHCWRQFWIEEERLDHERIPHRGTYKCLKFVNGQHCPAILHSSVEEIRNHLVTAHEIEASPDRIMDEYDTHFCPTSELMDPTELICEALKILFFVTPFFILFYPVQLYQYRWEYTHFGPGASNDMV